MPNVSFSASTPGVVFLGQRNNINSSSEHQRTALGFRVKGSSCNIAASAANPTNQPPSIYVDGVFVGYMTQADYSSTVKLFEGLADTWHDVVIVVNLPAYNPFFINTGINCIVVNGAAPAIDYIPGWGEAILPTMLQAADSVKTIQGGAVVYAEDNGVPVFGTANEFATPCLHFRGKDGNARGATVLVTTSNNGDVAILELWKLRPGASEPVMVARQSITSDGNKHLLTLTQDALEDCDYILAHNGRAGLSITGLCIAGTTRTKTMLPLASTGGLWANAVITGTSETVTAFSAQLGADAPSSYTFLTCISAKLMPWNLGVGGSALVAQSDGGSDISQRPGVSREQYFAAISPAPIVWLQCHAHNESKDAAALTKFQADLLAHIQRMLTAYPGLRVVNIAIEVPSSIAGLYPDFVAAMVGTVANPGIVRLVTTAIQAQFGTNRAFFVDTTQMRADLLAVVGGWSDDTIHPRAAVTPLMARDVIALAGAFLGVVVATGVLLAQASLDAIAALVLSSLVAQGYTFNRAQKLDYLTGDAYQRLGQPAGASIAADIAAGVDVTVNPVAFVPVALPLRVLETAGSALNSRISIAQGDNSPARQIEIGDAAGNRVDLTGATIQYRLKRAGSDDGDTITGNATIVSAPAGLVRYDWQPGDTDTPGLYIESWRITWANSDISTVPGAGNIIVEIRAN